MEIITPGSTKRNMTCNNCNCKFTYEDNEVKRSDAVNCPCCNEKLWISNKRKRYRKIELILAILLLVLAVVLWVARSQSHGYKIYDMDTGRLVADFNVTDNTLTRYYPYSSYDPSSNKQIYITTPSVYNYTVYPQSDIIIFNTDGDSYITYDHHIIKAY